MTTPSAEVRNNFAGEDEHLKSREDILLPWACCDAKELDKMEQADEAIRVEEEEEEEENGPVAMANSIRKRLKEKWLKNQKLQKQDKKPPSVMKRPKRPGQYKPDEEPVFLKGAWCTFSPHSKAKWHSHRGCGIALAEWFNDSADTLLVIGFCVIGFLKFTFLTILHYEIREMIQKIKMLENETNQMNGDLAGLTMSNHGGLVSQPMVGGHHVLHQNACGGGNNKDVCSILSSTSSSSSIHDQLSSGSRSKNNNLVAQTTKLLSSSKVAALADSDSSKKYEYHELTSNNGATGSSEHRQLREDTSYHAVFRESSSGGPGRVDPFGKVKQQPTTLPSHRPGDGSRQTAI